MYWTLLYRLASKYSAVIVLPVSAIIGYIGYRTEILISDRYTPTVESVKEKREKRLLSEEKEVQSIKEHSFIPKTIFEKNLSPSLKEPDPRLIKYKNKLED